MLTFMPRGKVIGEMSGEEASKTPVELGIRETPAYDGAVTISLEVDFKAVAFERPLVKNGYWYVGSTSAQLELRASGAEILKHTEGSETRVKNKIKRGAETKRKAKIKPAVEVGEEMEITAGELGAEWSKTEEAGTEFEIADYQLASSHAGDAVTWQYAIARGQQAFRDYLLTKLQLEADCKWVSGAPRGEVTLRSTAFYFGQEGERLEGWKSLLAVACLKVRGEISNPNGVAVRFVRSRKKT